MLQAIHRNVEGASRLGLLHPLNNGHSKSNNMRIVFEAAAPSAYRSVSDADWALEAIGQSIDIIVPEELRSAGQ
jgi:hypothetical protein